MSRTSGFIVVVVICALCAAPLGAAEPKLEPVIQTGHTANVTSVNLSSDGKYLATGASDSSAILWDARTGQKLRSFRHKDTVWSVCLSGDGKYLATGSTIQAKSEDDEEYSAGIAILWDAQTGQKLRSFEGHKAEVWSVSLSIDGKYLATGSDAVLSAKSCD